jgi:hypothetical protein
MLKSRPVPIIKASLLLLSPLPVRLDLLYFGMNLQSSDYWTAARILVVLGSELKDVITEGLPSAADTFPGDANTKTGYIFPYGEHKGWSLGSEGSLYPRAGCDADEAIPSVALWKGACMEECLLIISSDSS